MVAHEKRKPQDESRRSTLRMTGYLPLSQHAAPIAHWAEIGRSLNRRFPGERVQQVSCLKDVMPQIKPIVYLLASVCIAAASGCASRPPISFEPPAPAQCCSSWQSVQFENLGLEGVDGVSIKVGQNPTFDFAEGRSTFVAYKLPEPHPQMVEVRTYANASAVMLLPYVTIFKPRVLFLDESLHVTETNRLEPLTVQPRYFSNAYIFARAQIPAGAKYMVVYAASSANSERLVTHSENGTMFAVPNAYEGKISITFP